MANYATNIFYARTENKADLDKIEAFLDDTLTALSIDTAIAWMREFISLGLPGRRNRQAGSFVGAKDKTYIKILSIRTLQRRIRELPDLLTG